MGEYLDTVPADKLIVVVDRAKAARPGVAQSSVVKTSHGHSVHHKDLLPVVYVTGDMAGKTDSPLYGLFEISSELAEDLGLPQWFV